MSEFGSWTHHRARLGRAVRSGKSDEAEEARRDLQAARLADQIQCALNAWPPFTTTQREMLAALFTAPQTAGANEDHTPGKLETAGANEALRQRRVHLGVGRETNLKRGAGTRKPPG